MPSVRRTLLVLAVLAVAGCAVAAYVISRPDTGTGTPGSGGASVRTERHLTVDGRQRSYLLDVPLDLEEGAAPPLIVALHGGLSTPQRMAAEDGLVAEAAPRGVVVVHPAGTATTWNAGHCCSVAARDRVDDVAFVAAVLDDVQRTVGTDPARTYVTGHSNGGMLAYRLGCELSDRIAAIAPVEASYVAPACRHGRPVALLHVHGLADTNVPFAGKPGEPPPVLEGVTAWAAAAGCTGEPTTTTAGAVTVESWPGCPQTAPVRLITVAGQGHTWPDWRTPAIDLPKTVVDFFTAVGWAADRR